MRDVAFDSWVRRAGAIPIEREIDRRGIKLRGKIERVGPCPKCGGDDRFSINTKKGVWNCRVCDVGGDIIKLVEHLDGVDFIAACTTLTGEPPPERKIVAAEYAYEDENGAVEFVVERVEYQNPDGTVALTKDGKPKKTFRQRRPDPERLGSWIWNVKGVRVLPYRLPELIEALAQGHTVLIVEGEGKVDLLRSWNVPATCCAGGAKKWRAEHSKHLRGADVVIMPDNDPAGHEHVAIVASSLQGIAETVRALDLPGLPPKGDIVDWAAAGGTVEQLHDLIAHQAKPWSPDNAAPSPGADLPGRSHDELVAELATLSRFDYERRRKHAARMLGVTVNFLDKEVSKRRKESEKDNAALPHWQVEPWPDVVATCQLLDSIATVFTRYIVLPKHAAEALALWILHAWTFDAGDISPFVVLTSPTKRCGKTSVLILLNWLTPRSELASNISPSAIFRYIEDQQPTLLIDEADTFIRSSEEARGILNSGHTRAAAHVIRNVEIGGQHKSQRFSTWAPKAIACIGGLAGTLEDRAIIVPMQRKPRGAKVARCRRRDCAEFAGLRRQALRSATDNLERLRNADPKLPDVLNDRAADNWEPLLAIAELAGDAWALKACNAAKALSGDKAEADDDDGVELLRDIRLAFAGTDQDVFFTKALIAHLVADEERPWAAYGRTGKPISDRQIAKLLGPFGIISGTVRINGATAKGYHRSAFKEAWGSYSKPEKASQQPEGDSQPSQRHNRDETGTSSDFSSVTKPPCDGSKKCDLLNNDGHCDGVTVDAAEEEVEWTL